MYLTELRRDADTYHVMVATEATMRGDGKYDFTDQYSAAIRVDGELEAMTEPARIKEVLKRAEQSVKELRDAKTTQTV